VQERERPVELSNELVKSYADTFIPRWDWYPFQRSDTGTYYQLHKPLTLAMVHRHLTCHWTGEKPFTLGAYALSPDSTASWLCYDADEYEQWETLWQFAYELRQQGVPTYQEQSRVGGHLWLFTPELTGEDARTFGLHLLKRHNIDEEDIDHLYPRQAKLADGAGSFVRLPLGVHQKTGKVYHFVDLNGEPLAPTITDQIRILSNPDRVSMDFVGKILVEAAGEAEAVALEPPKFIVEVIPSMDRDDEPDVYISSPLSDTLKRTVTVHEYVSRYVELDSRGKGLCPFHDDTVKSFQVNISRDYWHCYGAPVKPHD
jgi:hypothetical protein